MAASTEILKPRWRRLDATLDELRGADPASDTEMPDAAVRVLDAMYHVWEVWSVYSGDARKDHRAQNDAVDPDPAGRTAAALAFARGAITHAHVELGQRHGFGQQPFGTSPFGVGSWHWRSYAEPMRGFHIRGLWYESLVAHRPVFEPIKTAVRWLEEQEAIQRP